MSPKASLRGEIKNRLNKIPKEDFYSEGLKAAILLGKSPIWSQYPSIFIFLSTDTEIDTRPLLMAALSDRKKIFVPKLETGTGFTDSKPAGRISFYSITSPDGPWHVGTFGIREPVSGKPPGTGDFPALILTPGLAFDRGGNRLGRGAGYYDRFFAQLDDEGKQYLAIGLCLDFQIVPLVPAEKNDKKMNGILTGKEFAILK